MGASFASPLVKRTFNAYITGIQIRNNVETESGLRIWFFIWPAMNCISLISNQFELVVVPDHFKE